MAVAAWVLEVDGWYGESVVCGGGGGEDSRSGGGWFLYMYSVCNYAIAMHQQQAWRAKCLLSAHSSSLNAMVLR